MPSCPKFNEGQVIEEMQHLSSSVIWSLQRGFYMNKGIDAWSEKIVPNFITTNTWIAKSYAKVVIGYLQDMFLGPLLQESMGFCSNTKVLDFSEPLYLIEFGAGMGRFCFYFLKAFHHLLEQIPYLCHLKICYVLTDCVEKNMEYCLKHPSLQSYIKEGLVDAAIFNSSNPPSEIHLMHSGKVLLPNTVVNPIVVVSNYFFCVVEQDAFMVDSDGVLSEALITTISTREKEIDLNDPSIICRTKKTFTYKLVENPATHYPEQELNHVLKQYVEDIRSYRVPKVEEGVQTGTSFLLPVGAARCLDVVSNLCKMEKRILVLCSDKGYNYLKEFIGHVGYPMSVEGSFSFMANLHALGCYFRERGGGSLHTSQHIESQGDTCLATSVYWLGSGTHPHLKAEFVEYLDRFGPVDFFRLVNSVPILNDDPLLEEPSDSIGDEDVQEQDHFSSIKEGKEDILLNENTYESINGVRVIQPQENQLDELPEIDDDSNPKVRMNLHQLMALWRASEYEPQFFWQMRGSLLFSLNDISPEEKNEVENALLKTFENLYYIGEEEDILFELGRCAYQLRLPNHRSAILFYEHSLNLFGEHYITYYNLALCYRENLDLKSAIDYLKKSIALEERYESALEALHEIETNMEEKNQSIILNI